jgi:hypothetical protein
MPNLGNLIDTALGIVGIAGLAASGFQVSRVRDLRGDRDDRDERIADRDKTIAERDAQLAEAKANAEHVQERFAALQADYESVRSFASGEQFWPKFDHDVTQMLEALGEQKAILERVDDNLDTIAAVARKEGSS